MTTNIVPIEMSVQEAGILVSIAEEKVDLELLNGKGSGCSRWWGEKQRGHNNDDSSDVEFEIGGRQQ